MVLAAKSSVGSQQRLYEEVSYASPHSFEVYRPPEAENYDHRGFSGSVCAATGSTGGTVYNPNLHNFMTREQADDDGTIYCAELPNPFADVQRRGALHNLYVWKSGRRNANHCMVRTADAVHHRNCDDLAVGPRKRCFASASDILTITKNDIAFQLQAGEILCHLSEFLTGSNLSLADRQI